MTSGGFPAKRLARVREVLERYVDAGYVPGAVAVVARHGEVHVEATGTLAFEGLFSRQLSYLPGSDWDPRLPAPRALVGRKPRGASS